MQPDRSIADDLCRFIDASPSPYHAVATARARLTDAGFVGVDIGAPLPSGAGARFVTVGGAIIAWRQGAGVPRAFRLIGAHTDSPNLRIKPSPDRVSAHVRQLGVEVYGGVLTNSWLDRDLGLSGRLTVRTPDGAESVLFRIDDPILRIPQLAIHLHREIATEGLSLNAQQHLSPMWDLDTDAGSDDGFTATVAAAAGVDADAVVAWDVMCHDLTPSVRSGRDGVFISAPRLDNLCSSHAAIEALCASSTDDDGIVPIVCLYDHEEIGSTSTTGADSTLVANMVERIVSATGGGRDEFLRAMTTSVCVSADMAHATHPNYVDKHDPDHHITMNDGVVIKLNANQRYASDADSVGIFAHHCAAAGVPVQYFVGRNDIPCGSTIGPVTSARLGMTTVDVGVAQLAMHSAREIAGADDPSYYLAAMTDFLGG